MTDESAKAEARDALLPFTRGIAFGQVIESVAHGVAVDDEVEIARSTLQLEAGDEGEKVNKACGACAFRALPEGSCRARTGEERKKGKRIQN
jgi:hypothetical protein